MMLFASPAYFFGFFGTNRPLYAITIVLLSNLYGDFSFL
jgi:hypothetical protein